MSNLQPGCLVYKKDERLAPVLPFLLTWWGMAVSCYLTGGKAFWRDHEGAHSGARWAHCTKRIHIRGFDFLRACRVSLLRLPSRECSG